MPHFVTQTKVNPVEEFDPPKMLGGNKLVSLPDSKCHRERLA